MNMSVSYVNMILQGGIYYFELNEESKNRPFLVISKDNGYGKDVLAFVITERFTSTDVSLPIVLNNYVSFIRVSGSKEVPKSKIINSSFNGVLIPDVFNIAIRMYMRRFAIVNEEELEKDLNNYLDKIEKEGHYYYLDRKKRFRKKEYLRNQLFLEDSKAKIVFPEKEENNVNISKSNTINGPLDDEVMKDFTLKQLFTIKRMIHEQSKKDIQKKYLLDNWKCDYICSNIERLITRKKRGENVYKKKKKK